MYHFVRQLWLNVGVKSMEFNSNGCFPVSIYIYILQTLPNFYGENLFQQFVYFFKTTIFLKFLVNNCAKLQTLSAFKGLKRQGSSTRVLAALNEHKAGPPRCWFFRVQLLVFSKWRAFQILCKMVHLHRKQKVSKRASRGTLLEFFLLERCFCQFLFMFRYGNVLFEYVDTCSFLLNIVYQDLFKQKSVQE